MQCKCDTLDAVADVSMGHHDDILAHFQERARHINAWWLSHEQCLACCQHWLVAADTRINDVFLMRRLKDEERSTLESSGLWPPDFLRFEDVLDLGRQRGHNWTFQERLSPALVDTIVDLVAARPNIDTRRLAYLLNVDLPHANELATHAETKCGMTVARNTH